MWCGVRWGVLRLFAGEQISSVLLLQVPRSDFAWRPILALTFKQSELFHSVMRFSESELPVTLSIQLTFTVTSASTALEEYIVLGPGVRRPKLKDLCGLFLPVWPWEIHFAPLILGLLLCKVRLILYREGMSYGEVVSHKLNEMMSIKAFYKLKNAVLMCVSIRILEAWK